jgi:hypothetical protein
VTITFGAGDHNTTAPNNNKPFLHIFGAATHIATALQGVQPTTIMLISNLGLLFGDCTFTMFYKVYSVDGYPLQLWYFRPFQRFNAKSGDIKS